MSDADSFNKSEKDESSVLKSTVISGEQLQQTPAAEKVSPWTLTDLHNEFKHVEDQRKAEIETALQERVQPEVERLLANVRQAAHEEAYQKGYEEGYALGHQEGLTVGEAKGYSETRETLFDKLQQIDQILQSFNQPYKELEAQLWKDISRYSLFLAEQVLQREVTHNKEWLEHLVQESVAKLSDSENPIEVFINDQDFAFLQEQEAELLQQWDIKPNEKVPPGGCQLQQKFSTLRVDWQDRFTELSKKVESSLASPSE